MRVVFQNELIVSQRFSDRLVVMNHHGNKSVSQLSAHYSDYIGRERSGRIDVVEQIHRSLKAVPLAAIFLQQVLHVRNGGIGGRIGLKDDDGMSRGSQSLLQIQRRARRRIKYHQILGSQPQCAQPATQPSWVLRKLGLKGISVTLIDLPKWENPCFHGAVKQRILPRTVLKRAPCHAVYFSW